MLSILAPELPFAAGPTPQKYHRPDAAPAIRLADIEHVRFRFDARVSKCGPAECWLWLGAVQTSGYGRLHVRPNVYLAHRLAYVFANDYIGPNLTIDHLCKVRLCCNPSHLEAVTLSENVRRSKNGDRCKRGHPLDRIVVTRSGSQHRACKTCDAARQRSYEPKLPPKTCDLCGSSVRPKNFARHLRNVHKAGV